MIESLIERFGEPALSAAAGLAIGAVFGILAQLTRFCMRSATIEVGRGVRGDRLPLWLLAVGVALAATQGLIATGIVTTDPIRQLTSGGSWSGAAIGGLLFGVGMVLTRGCVSRLMVLTASGNMRALVTTGIFLLVAYATMRGALGDARNAIAGLYPAAGGLDIVKSTGIGAASAALIGLAVVAVALVLGSRRGLSPAMTAGGVLIGLLVAGTYAITAGFHAASFDPQPVRGLSFIATIVNTAAGVVQKAPKLDFDAGLIPGVFFGAFVAAVLGRSFRIEWFASPLSTLRYIAGAALMGFGGVLAGGCSMGNGVSGMAILAAPAAVALAFMWIGATLADALFDRRATKPAALPSDYLTAIKA
jgi:uncharacterized membrane protein YedE/YeeE